tara:strand:+ start:503 stop:811 length:309 start_codon:yes stop_codon:yes gene_type:complete
MPKRSRESPYECNKRAKVDSYATHAQKRKFDGEYQSNKRQRVITEEYIERLQKDNQLAKQACTEAMVTIEHLQERVKQLEFLLNIQRTQMERIRVNNNVIAY